MISNVLTSAVTLLGMTMIKLRLNNFFLFDKTYWKFISKNSVRKCSSNAGFSNQF